MHMDLEWRGSARRIEWRDAGMTLGGDPSDTHLLEGAPAGLVALRQQGQHRLVRTCLPSSLGALSFPAHVWRLWSPGETLSVGGLQVSWPVETPTRAPGTAVLARHLLCAGEAVPPRGTSLVVLSGRDVGRRLFLGRSGEILGRGRGATLALTDETVSRAHLGFRRHEGAWWVEDLGGPNGLFVDGRQWRGCALQDGAVLELGRVWLRFEEGSAPPFAAEPAALLEAQAQAPCSPTPTELPVTEDPRTPPPGPGAPVWLRAVVGVCGALALLGAAWA